MTTYTIGNDTYPTLAKARQTARSRNEIAPQTEIVISRDGRAEEIWVGPVTFMPAGPGAYIAYSSADIDSIGAVRRIGSVFVAGNRGADIGTFLNLFDAAHALHDHAMSAAYRYA